MEQLQRHNCRRAQVFSAVEGRVAMKLEPARWLKRMKKDEVEVLPTPEGAIGCFLSHYEVLKAAREAR